MVLGPAVEMLNSLVNLDMVLRCKDWAGIAHFRMVLLSGRAPVHHQMQTQGRQSLGGYPADQPAGGYGLGAAASTS